MALSGLTLTDVASGKRLSVYNPEMTMLQFFTIYSFIPLLQLQQTILLMTYRKLMKWREKILAGKDKYYPKELIESVRNMVKLSPIGEKKTLKNIKVEEEKVFKQAIVKNNNRTP